MNLIVVLKNEKMEWLERMYCKSRQENFTHKNLLFSRGPLEILVEEENERYLLWPIDTVHTMNWYQETRVLLTRSPYIFLNVWITERIYDHDSQTPKSRNEPTPLANTLKLNFNIVVREEFMMVAATYVIHDEIAFSCTVSF